MQKTKLLLKAHNVNPMEQAVEVIHQSELMGCVYGADGPGMRFITRHEVDVKTQIGADGLTVVTITVKA